MTDYANLPDTSALYHELEMVNRAIATLDAGGSMTSASVGNAPPQQDGAFLVATVPAPSGSVSAATNRNLRAWLAERSAALGEQLAGLGVTAPPAPPPVPPTARTARTTA